MNPVTTTYAIINLASIVEILSITLAIIALAITIVGFFASLKFYRDGVQLQDNVNKALSIIGEKTEHIQTQVGDMFNKTLDAAIGQRSKISENFEHIQEQIGKTAKDIVDKSIKQIGAAGEIERERLIEIVNKQMEPLRKKIDATRESTEELTVPKAFTQFESDIVTVLMHSNKPLTPMEIGNIVQMSATNFSRAMNSLLHKRIISVGDRGTIYYNRKKE